MEGERFTVRLTLEANDRRGLYADLAAAVSATGTDIKSMELRTIDGRVNGSALVEVENLAHLEKIMKAARKVKGVSEVARREHGDELAARRDAGSNRDHGVDRPIFRTSSVPQLPFAMPLAASTFRLRSRPRAISRGRSPS